jgi:hypothetical protein
MNTIIKLFSLVFIVLFASCSDDDKTEEKNQGFLKIGDHTVQLSQSYLESYGIRGNAYNIDFSARSEAISGQNDGAVIYFELFSSIEKDLEKGDYNLGSYSAAIANTYTKWGQSLLGKNISINQGGLSVVDGISIRPSSGTFTVSESGENYKVSFSGKGAASYYTDGVLTSSQDNVSFSMEYKGDVKRYENKAFSSKKINSKERMEKQHTIIF